MFEAVKQQGVMRDDFTYIALISVCVENRQPKLASQLEAVNRREYAMGHPQGFVRRL